MLNFLETASLTNTDMAGSNMNLIPPQFMAALIGFGIAALFVLALLYVYVSLAFMKIGAKAGLKSPGIAWINPIITIFEASGMHWWPWPTVICGYFLSIFLLVTSPILGGLLTFAIVLTFIVMTVIWQWKTFEVVKKPGWWALVSPIICIIGLLLTFIVPLLGLLLYTLAGLIYLILIGIAAWSQD
jgi:hypothetical protein